MDDVKVVKKQHARMLIRIEDLETEIKELQKQLKSIRAGRFTKEEVEKVKNLISVEEKK